MTRASDGLPRGLYRLSERHQLLDYLYLVAAGETSASVGGLGQVGSRVHRSCRKVDDAVFDFSWQAVAPTCTVSVTDSQLYDSLARLDDRLGLSALRITWKCRRRCSRRLSKIANVRLLEHALPWKPFGHDLASALELRPAASGVGRRPNPACGPLSGQQPVVELEYLRFANQALAELWDPGISEIHITGLRGGGPRQVLRRRRCPA